VPLELRVSVHAVAEIGLVALAPRLEQ